MGDQLHRERLATWSGLISSLPVLSSDQRRGLVQSSSVQFLCSLLKIASLFGDCCMTDRLKKHARIVHRHTTALQRIKRDKPAFKEYLSKKQHLLRLVGEIWREGVSSGNEDKLLAKLPKHFHYREVKKRAKKEMQQLDDTAVVPDIESDNANALDFSHVIV